MEATTFSAALIWLVMEFIWADPPRSLEGVGPVGQKIMFVVLLSAWMTLQTAIFLVTR